ncbi:helix-turn-helix transcriptional regulator [Spinactinospora alkalitolerans]
MERGTRAPRRDHSESLDTALSTGGFLTRLWEELTNQRDVPAWFRDALLLERRATELREYQPVLIPGLLQSSDYARTLIRARRVRASADQVDQVTKARTERFPALLPNRPLLWFIVDQAVLTRVIGSEKIMSDQLGHVAELVEGEMVRFQVIPPTRRHPGLCPPFRLIALNDSQTVAYAEHALGGETIDAAERVNEASTLFGTLLGEALPPDASLDLIRTIQKEMTR